MLHNILNLKGITILGKKDQENINGGGDQVCRLTVKRADGITEVLEFDNYSDGALGSSQANSDCAFIMNSSMGHQSCHYDCAYDGFHQ